VAAALGVRVATAELAVALRIGLAVGAGALAYAAALRLLAPELFQRAQGLVQGALPGRRRAQA
jgi:hypothetical protein